MGVDEAGLQTWQVYFAGVVPPTSDSNPRRTYIGSHDNGNLCSNDAGASGWTPSGTFWAGDSFAFQYAPSNPERAYWSVYSGSTLFYRTDNARTGCSYPYTNWASVSSLTWPRYLSRNTLAVDPADQNEVYFVQRNFGVARSTDGAVSWTTFPLPGGYSAVSVYVDARGVVYAGTEGHGVYYSKDDGATWNPGGLNDDSPELVLGIATDGLPDPTEWLATTSGLYRLAPGGVWTLIDGGGGYVVNDVAVDPNCPSRVYWAKGFVARRQQHRGGIMVTHNNGATITNITAGSSFHNGPVADVEVDRFDKHYVYAASYGQGFWFYDWGDPMPGCGT